MITRHFGLLLASPLIFALAACSTGGLSTSKDSPYAPGRVAGAEAVDGLLVGHRLMEAGEYELALRAFTRAAGEYGMTVDVLAALGSANIGLGRLGQAEKLLRRATETDEAVPEAWNNLGVILMERGEYAEAAQIFQRAYALDDGQSDSIRDNLRLALAKSDNSGYDDVEEQQNYKLVRRGSSDFLIRSIP
ncbi:tetratricopeptide repeat protein [Lentibacter sp. XHP0401]|uniref:tetratricopeptide repeat protein n=1 Tax=Lentibacter sp. XHP0401 TaxID=2984334 RepID=UPI0021E7964C|nr:tetratricopeptide repeat protein [Lentibacter sp. XHP0401]MCV2893058.1 tetratricopeptide repeat protein [Lentibacter sp. XHP0401]